MPNQRLPKVLLLGSGGQLGQLLAAALPSEYEVVALSRVELDFSNEAALRSAVRESFGVSGPDFLVNAAAYTAVDRAEQDRDMARAVNGIAPGILAEELHKIGNGKAWLNHYSTDYVFDGSGVKPWVETDPTGPLGVYGQTKLEGEQAIAATGCPHVILRTSWVYAAVGKNFLHTMLRLGRERQKLSVVDDQIGAPTTAEALTAATQQILRWLRAHENSSEASGVYHLACAGETSWCGFAKAIFTNFASRQTPPDLTPIPTEAYPTPAKRPSNSRLDCSKVASQFGVQMPHWEEALQAVTETVLKAQPPVQP
jgi:dTDP-4-dehydrorhamnose reductase